MMDTLTEISKIGIKSIFTAEKYNNELLEEDLDRITFIRNYIEEYVLYANKAYSDFNTEEYSQRLKNYALEFFLKQCEDLLSDEEKDSDDYDSMKQRNENEAYFNYIFDNLEYPE